MEQCLICKQGVWSPFLQTQRLKIESCNFCGHHRAHHLVLTTDQKEYDQLWQNANPDYLKSLSDLRQTQAIQICSQIKILFGIPKKWCDFGTGRGWFPIELKKNGIPVVGVDASPAALDFLKEFDIQTAVINDFRNINSMVPDITGLSLLDVLEHFKIESIRDFLQVLSSQSQLRYLVVKVPVIHGFFYRLSCFFSKWGFTGPLETLYQVGTEPPHEVYFSEKSIEILIQSFGFKLVKKIRDPDFESDQILERILKRKISIPGLSFIVGFFLKYFISTCKLQDSTIYFFTRD